MDELNCNREKGPEFLPKFDENGLLTAVVQHFKTGQILMVAFMNMDAVAATQGTGKAHFYSRSRKKQWMKGETSGNTLTVREILVDCDQDAIVLKVDADGPTCHTGAVSCFYRKLQNGNLGAAED